jgi:hypothetical protein
MSLLKSFFVVSCIAILALVVLQTTSKAELIDEWLMDDPGNPIAYGAPCPDTLGTRNLKYENAYGYNPGAYPYSTTGRWGAPNTAVHFGGQYGVATSSPGYGAGSPSTWAAYNLSSYTIEGFFMRDSDSKDQQFFYAEAGWGGPFLFLGVQNNAVSFGSIDTANWMQLTGTSALTPGQWYYTAAVVNNNVPTLYLYDGTTMQSWTGPTLGTRRASTDGYFETIGAGISRSNWCFVGTVDNIRIYDGALDQATVLAHATTDAPEPSTFVLFASGLLGLTAYAWRKRK